jgi:hypothetical protein
MNELLVDVTCVFVGRAADLVPDIEIIFGRSWLPGFHRTG